MKDRFAAGRLLGLVAVSLWLGGCSSSSSVNQIWVSSAEEGAIDSLLIRGRTAYDKGRYSEALSLGEQALAINSDVERSAVFVGYVHLALAGIETFSLAKNLIEMQSASTTKKTALAEASSGVSDVLGQLTTVLGLTSDDILKMGELQESTATPFSDLPVILPSDADEMRAAVEPVSRVNQAIMAVCRFVDDEAKVATDSRHGSESCKKTSAPRRLGARAHFLWAFAHLTEAIAINAALQYSTNSAGKANLIARMENLKSAQIGTDLSAINEFVTMIEDFQETVDAILPTDNPNSQFRALTADMTAVTAGFARIAGVPASVTDSITKSMDSINAVAGQGEELAQSQTAKMKEVFTGKLSTQLSSKIDELAAKENVTQEQITTACQSWGAISGAPEASAIGDLAGAPEACKS